MPFARLCHERPKTCAIEARRLVVPWLPPRFTGVVLWGSFRHTGSLFSSLISGPASRGEKRVSALLLPRDCVSTLTQYTCHYVDFSRRWSFFLENADFQGLFRKDSLIAIPGSAP